MFELFLTIFYIGITMYLANIVDAVGHTDNDRSNFRTAVNGLLYLLTFFILLFAFRVIFVDAEQITSILSFVLMIGCAVLSFRVIYSLEFRQTVQQYIGNHGRYTAESTVHTTAIVLSLALLASFLLSFVLQGGIEGIAETIDDEGVAVGDIFVQTIIQVAAAFLGVGWAIRRTLPQTLTRLGLRMPTRDDIVQGVGVGVSLILLLWLYGIIMSLFAAVGLFSDTQNDAANELAVQFSTVSLALLLATFSSIGEEVMFRGALQPIFGNVLVSVLFALIHTQLLFTPGMVFIFVVSYLLGRVRERYSTSASIIAHFVYNFVQLLLLILVSQAGV